MKILVWQVLDMPGTVLMPLLKGCGSAANDIHKTHGWKCFCCRSGFQQSEMVISQFLFRSYCFSANAMQNASLIHRMSTFLAFSITDALFHIGWCCSAQACSNIADLSFVSGLSEDLSRVCRRFDTTFG